LKTHIIITLVINRTIFTAVTAPFTTCNTDRWSQQTATMEARGNLSGGQLGSTAS
jgi:hypothetical protein